MRGLVFKPPRPAARCCIPSQHEGQERPAAAYLVFADGCRATRCDGQLWCNGHSVCIDCGMGVREGRLIYARPEIKGELVSVAAVTSAGRTGRR